MASSETPKATSYPPDAEGHFSVDKEVCANYQQCFEGIRGLLGRAEVNGRFKTYVRRQPSTDKEIQMVSQAAARCPINAILYDGDGTHPYIFEHGIVEPAEQIAETQPIDQPES